MAKRTAEGFDDVATKKIKAADGSEVNVEDLHEIRMLVDNTESSVIIGKAGTNVQNVRRESGAFVSIMKTESPDSKERVMTVKGTLSAIAKAVQLMAELLIANQPSGMSNDEYTMKILIHKFLAGCIIGKGGSIIREINESTKARLSLSVEALGCSTEKTVSISGTADAINLATNRVVDQLVNNPLKAGCSTIFYVPGVTNAYPGGPAGGHGGHGGYGGPPPQSSYGAPVGYGAPPPMQQGYGAPYGAPSQNQPRGPPQFAVGAIHEEKKVEKIVIPTICAGFVIGKAGQTIRDIKNQSGTFVSIADASPTSPEDRVVTITGTSQGIQTAIHHIRQKVEAYTPL